MAKMCCFMERDVFPFLTNSEDVSSYGNSNIKYGHVFLLWCPLGLVMPGPDICDWKSLLSYYTSNALVKTL